MPVNGTEQRGRVTISSAPGITAANLEGRLSGKGVSGTLLDDDGQTLAYFEGAVTAADASGTLPPPPRPGDVGVERRRDAVTGPASRRTVCALALQA